ncbi:MAG: DNA-processing protein DprA [Lachnospiraceae bacterium]|nr:DNA-processing protein DprA [Lachnospiraceae bacterium]
MKTEDFYWYWLNTISGIGNRTIGRLLDRFGTPKQIYHTEEREIASVLRTKKQQSAFHMSKNKAPVIDSYNNISAGGITFLHPDSPLFPERLKTIPDMPYGLYLKGILPPEEKKTVAMIGARSCTRYGKEMARFFASELAGCGVGIISGLARGVDGMAHVGALEADGYTLGVLGGGIDQIYPIEHAALFQQIEQSGGLISESGPGIQPVAGLFPMRNRLIAGFADGILVVEAMEKSGTFITVDQGLEQGKEIFALPGRLTDSKSAGCNRLIQMGAHIVTGVEDVLELLQIDNTSRPKRNRPERSEEEIHKMSLAPLEKMVYSCLRIEPKYVDVIISEVRVAPQEVCMALNQLVLCGAVVETTRNYYAIKL